MKDLFSGSLGKLNNKGGSRIFTTPHTIAVASEYEVITDIPSAAEFVTSSLDGRLWVWKRSRRFYVSVFRWDDDSQKLVFTKTFNFNNINIIGRGLDWILTDTAILMASNDEPYLFTANIFADSNNSFLFSTLRSKILASGIDPLTNSAWGLDDNNGNSDGYGFFNRSALLQSVNKHYSLLPAVGDWNIIGNFLVHRPDNPLSETHNSMLNIRPLIPLEFKKSNNAYGCGFDNDISLTCYNGQLWARGLYHIGKCYILPAVFDEYGNPQEFYLYISPDYPNAYLDNNNWLNMSILHTDTNLYGFLSKKVSSLDNGLCYSSDSPMLFAPASREWLQLSDNGSMFIDTLNNSGLVIHDSGAVFLNGDNPSFECNALKQWLAPAGNVEAVTHNCVISSVDNATIATHFQQGFYRELLPKNKLPLSATAFSGKRLSINLNSNNNITINSLNNEASRANLDWNDIYREAINIKLLNSFTSSSGSNIAGYPIFTTNFRVLATVFPYDSYPNALPGSTWRGFTDTPKVTVWVDGGGVGYGTDIYGNLIAPAFEQHAEATFFYTDPDTGSLSEINITADFHSEVSTYYDKNYQRDVYDFYEDAIADVPHSVTIQDGYIGFSCSHYVLKGSSFTNTHYFHPCAKLPDNILRYNSKNNGNLSLSNVAIPSKLFPSYRKFTPLSIPNGNSCCMSAVFSEAFSKSIFLCDIPSAISIKSNGSYSGKLNIGQSKELHSMDELLNFWDGESLFEDNSVSFCKNGLHIISFYRTSSGSHCFFVLRSELHPEIFNFNSEFERSKLF